MYGNEKRMQKGWSCSSQKEGWQVWPEAQGKKKEKALIGSFKVIPWHERERAVGKLHSKVVSGQQPRNVRVAA